MEWIGEWNGREIVGEWIADEEAARETTAAGERIEVEEWTVVEADKEITRWIADEEAATELTVAEADKEIADRVVFDSTTSTLVGDQSSPSRHRNNRSA